MSAIRVYDFLTWLFILFPLLTGGVWGRYQGKWIEFSEMAVPTLIWGLFALGFWRFKKISFYETWTFKRGHSLFRQFESALRLKPRQTLLAYVIVVGSLWSFASLKRHWAFESHGSDLGIFDNAIWNLTHGNGYMSSLRGYWNLFGDHQSPIFWLLAPLYSLLPRAETLLLIQGFGLATTGIGLFLIIKKTLSDDPEEPAHRFAALSIIGLALYMPLRSAILYDFHPEVFMLPCFLFAVNGFQSKEISKRWIGFLFLILALAGKESAGAVAAGVGLALFINKSTRRWGVVSAVLGITVFLFDLKVVPKLFGRDYLFTGMYGDFSGNLNRILLSPFLEPKLFWSHIFEKHRLKFLLFTAGPWGFAPFFAPFQWIAALPGYLMLFLTRGPLRLNLHFHYAIEPLVGLLIALPWGFKTWIRSRYSPKIWLWTFSFAMILFSDRSVIQSIRYYSSTSHSEWLSTEVLPKISKDIFIQATDPLIPHLSNRKWITEPDFKMESSPEIECTLIDSSFDPWPLNNFEKAIEMVPKNLALEYACGSFKAFGKKCFFSEERPHCPKD